MPRAAVAVLPSLDWSGGESGIFITFDPIEPASLVYGGILMDVWAVQWFLDEDHGPERWIFGGPAAFLDFPISFIGDTILIPLTIIQQIELLFSGRKGDEEHKPVPGEAIGFSMSISNHGTAAGARSPQPGGGADFPGNPRAERDPHLEMEVMNFSNLRFRIKLDRHPAD